MDIIKPISLQTRQLVSEYGLGYAKAEYVEHLSVIGLLFILPLLLCFILAMAFIALPLLFSILITDNWMQWLVGLLFVSVFGFFLILMGALFMIMLRVLWVGVRRVYLGEKGFITTDRRRETVVRWEAVQEIRRRISFSRRKVNGVEQVTSHHLYMIVPAEGKKYTLSGDPGPAIEQAVTSYLLPRMVEHYVVGRMLSFGWLTLNNEGLYLTPEAIVGDYPTRLEKFLGVVGILKKLFGTCLESGENFLPWEDVAGCWIDESCDSLVLSKAGEHAHWAILPLYQVPNSALCLAVIKYALYDKSH